MYISVNINCTGKKKKKTLISTPPYQYKLYQALTDGHFDSDFVRMAH